MTKKLDTPEEIAHAAKRDEIIKNRPQEWAHIQEERQKIRAKKTKEALADAAAIKELDAVKFEQPTVSKDGSGQREDVKRPMYASKPLIREWIDKIIKLN